METKKETDEGGGQEFWAIVELMGHRRLAGYVREVQLAGAGFLRLDVHERCTKSGKAAGLIEAAEADGDPFCPDHKCRSPHDIIAATQFIAPASLYALTPVTEEVARAVAKTAKPEPVHPWEMPALEDKRGLRHGVIDEGPDGYDPDGEVDEAEDFCPVLVLAENGGLPEQCNRPAEWDTESGAYRCEHHVGYAERTPDGMPEIPRADHKHRNG
jgi:hypothetical protein